MYKPLIPLASVVAAVFTANAAEDPFSLIELPQGYMLAQAPPTDSATEPTSPDGGKMPEGKCAEGQCAAAMKQHQMPEGVCGVMDMQGMVMNENTDRMPPGCPAVSEDVQITVKAGRKYAEDYNGTAFGFDANEWKLKPCTRLTVRFINEDDIRHQWMVHGLPRFIYSLGMFHMEVNGRGEKTGTFIVPAEDETYLVHCDIAQHMEKGMKGQLVVGKGNGDLPSIPGVSGPLNPESKFSFFSLLGF
ncbi:MAG: cupredoxin domain-containing protein [Gammaproteobacteria bacterium]